MDWTAEKVKELYENAESRDLIQLHYARGETGWALPAGEDEAIIGNTSFEVDLRILDVVKMVPCDYCGCGRKAAGEVVFRVHKNATRLIYPMDNISKRWTAIKEAVKEVDGAIEGMVEGIAEVVYGCTTEDLMAALQKHNVDYKFEPWEERS